MSASRNRTMARDGAPTRSRQTLDNQPYATTDFSLAVTLLTLGIRPVNQRGEIAKRGDQIEWREIDTKLLDQTGKSFEQAEREGLGEIAYGFANHPLRSDVIKEFRRARARFQETAGDDIPDEFAIKCECGKDHTLQIVPLLATFAAFLFGSRKYLADRRKHAKARLRETHSVTRTDDTHETTYSTHAPKDL